MFVKWTDGHPMTYDKVMFVIVLSNRFNDEVVFVMGSASGGFLMKGHQVVVTLGVLPWGKVTRACSRLVV